MTRRDNTRKDTKYKTRTQDQDYTEDETRQYHTTEDKIKQTEARQGKARQQNYN
jgi:hypothetical protein